MESAESLINAMFFDPRRYDLAKVGRYKFNKKLALKNRINGHVLAEDVVDVTTGEIIAEAGTEVTRSLADDIQNAAVPYVWIQTETRNVKVLSSMMVDLRHYVDCDPKELGITELVYYPILAPVAYTHLREAVADLVQQMYDATEGDGQKQIMQKIYDGVNNVLERMDNAMEKYDDGKTGKVSIEVNVIQMCIRDRATLMR